MVFAGFVGCVALGGCGYFVWPTPWRYGTFSHQGNVLPTRTHRWTECVQVMLPGKGWGSWGGACD